MAKTKNILIIPDAHAFPDRVAATAEPQPLVLPEPEAGGPPRLRTVPMLDWLYTLEGVLEDALGPMESFADLLEVTREPSSPYLRKVASAHIDLSEALGAMREARELFLEERCGKK